MSGLIAVRDEYDAQYARIENAGSVPTPFGKNYVALTGYCGPYNPNLFAAAPDLLEACKALIFYDEADASNGIKLMLAYNDALAAARAAIAKATQP